MPHPLSSSGSPGPLISGSAHESVANTSLGLGNDTEATDTETETASASASASANASRNAIRHVTSRRKRVSPRE